MSGTQMGGPARMRANRTVVASKCLTCGQGFTFGEEVCACDVCGGFHHASCWDRVLICQHNVSSVAGPTADPVVASPPPQPPPPVAPGAPRTPTADEQYCPQCREIIKTGALKCRYCGYILSAQLAAQEISPAKAREIDKAANTALTCGIIGLFICGPVLGSVAIVQANKAIREIDMAPQYSSSRGKATAGRILGFIAWVGWILIFIIRMSNMPN